MDRARLSRRPRTLTPALACAALACWLLVPAAAAGATPKAAVATSTAGAATSTAGAATSTAGAAATPTGGAPVVAGASTGGPIVQLNAGAMVTASGDGLTLAARPWDMLRRAMVLGGSAPASLVGDVVEIQRLGPGARSQWTPIASAVIGSGGTFDARWIAGRTGRFWIRAVVVAPAAAMGADAATALPAPGAPATTPMTINVYRRSFATLYGPGLYGRLTACGERLRRSTIGVANRTLPCGTPVAIYYRGASMIVPVIDRGPYAKGADWDLTIATARALGLEANADIGAVALPRATGLSQARRLAARRL